MASDFQKQLLVIFDIFLMFSIFYFVNRRSSASYVDLRYCLHPFVEKRATKIDVEKMFFALGHYCPILGFFWGGCPTQQYSWRTYIICSPLSDTRGICMVLLRIDL